jgi:DNA-binding phage protein
LRRRPEAPRNSSTARRRYSPISKAAFEDGDPELIAAALNDVYRAKGRANDALTAQSDITSVIGTLKALGLELTAKAA